MSTVFTAIFCIFFVILVFAQMLLRYIYDYDIQNENEIMIVLFKIFPVFKFSLNDILDIREYSLKEAWTPSLENFKTIRLGNRLYGKMLLIQKKTGIFRSFIITPDKPQEYTKWFEMQRKSKRLPE